LAYGQVHRKILEIFTPLGKGMSQSAARPKGSLEKCNKKQDSEKLISITKTKTLKTRPQEKKCRD